MSSDWPAYIRSVRGRQHHSILSHSRHQFTHKLPIQRTLASLQICPQSLLWLAAGLSPARPSSALPRAASTPARSRRLTLTRPASVTPSSTYESHKPLNLDRAFCLTDMSPGSPRCHVWCFDDRRMVSIPPNILLHLPTSKYFAPFAPL